MTLGATQVTATTLFDEDLQRRARRLLGGDRRTDDLDRLYLGLRSRARGFDAVREIGDFVAHRDTRDKGLITQVGRDVFTSVDVWSMSLRGLKPSSADIARAADANLRLATDAQIMSGCGCARSRARKRVESALQRIERGDRISMPEARALDYLGNRFIWKPAFSADQLVDEFGAVLIRAGLIGAAERAQLGQARSFLALHALAVRRRTAAGHCSSAYTCRPAYHPRRCGHPARTHRRPRARSRSPARC
jgi:hypothetical protein